MLWDLFNLFNLCSPGFGGSMSTRNLDDLPLSVSVLFAVSLSLCTHLVVPFF